MPEVPPAERPKIRALLTAEELEGMAEEAGMSAEGIAKALAPLSGLPGGALHLAMEAGESLYVSMGLKTGKTAELSLASSYGSAVRGLVFALTSLGHDITAAFDTPSGAFFEATLPRDFLSRPGTLQFDVVDAGPNAARISGASEIKGQIYDWGKGKRALAEVFAKTEAFARRLGG